MSARARAAQREVEPRWVPYWKHDGGYLSAVKILGRWYYLGDRHSDIVRAAALLAECGVKLRRVQGMPPGIAALVARHGAVLGAYKRLPSFFERIGKPPSGGRKAIR